MRDVRRELKQLQVNEDEKQSRVDYLRYRIEELEKADLQIGEKEELIALRNRYRNSERIAEAINVAKELLTGGEDSDGAASLLTSAVDALEDGQPYLSELEPLTQRLRDMVYDLEDVQETLRDLSQDMDYNPEEAERVEQRLDLLYRLSRKYGETEEEMLSCLSEMELTAAYEAAKETAIDLARALSEHRTTAAEEFAEKVKEQLSFLNMAGIRFSVSQERVPLNSMGCDEMEFLIAANVGEEPKPIAKIASGGELSRIMLAIKTVLSDGDVGTLIFDEIDTGISGVTAEKVGLKLREVSRTRQVICVTHLAQIAALGDPHFFIEKQVENGRTCTHVQKLEFDGRCREIARIMGGSEITPLLLQNAEAMLKK